jgi:deoxyribodipyrimidine photo-lyase
MRTLLWFRGKDLRVHDHAALHAAARDSRELVPVFVLSAKYFGPGATEVAPHRVQFLLASLRELATELAARGSELQILKGPAERVIPELAARLKVDRVLVSAAYEPEARARDERIASALQAPFVRYRGELLIDPHVVRTGAGGVFKVYTPFARSVREQLKDLKLYAAPGQLPPLPAGLKLRTAALPTLKDPNANIIAGGERAGRERLQRFLAGPVDEYPSERDRMDHEGTSRLGADLHFGTLSARSVWCALADKSDVSVEARERFSAELLWREFAHYTLWNRPSVLTTPFRPEFNRFPWQSGQSGHRDSAGFEAWWRGTTGYPIVDASARQLLADGFVHNRARMISASFLTKHQLIDYRRGEAHYYRYLTDGDLAQNNLGWQWSAGCGCDAQPYFRVFNPITQGQRFDPEGDYVRRYVPELAQLPARYIHAPWTAPAAELERAGVRLGKTYPRPIVDHAEARKRFLLVASEHLKSGANVHP